MFWMSGPTGEVSLVLRFDLEIESIRPVQDLILGFHLVISIAFHLETLAVYQVAAFLLLLEWQVKNSLDAFITSSIKDVSMPWFQPEINRLKMLIDVDYSLRLNKVCLVSLR
jgi:hypothetical protein